MGLGVAKLIPGFLRRANLIRKERLRLGGIVSLPCAASALANTSGLDVPGILASADIGQAWERARPVLDRFPIVGGHGGVNPGDRRAIFHFVWGLAPSSVLEIGTHVGASTLNIAAALSQLVHERESPRRFVTVDIADVNCPANKPWRKFGTLASPAQMMRETGFDSFVQFVTSDSLAFFEQNREKFDFIFLDGNHAATAVYREIPAALRSLTPGGAILLHDYFPRNRPLWSNGALIPGPFLATERLRAEGANVRVLPLGTLPWPTKANSNVTSLALLLRDD